MFRFFAIVYGLFFLLFGIFGLIPFLKSEGLLFFIFKVNIATNIIHILTGIMGLVVIAVQSYFERLYFQIIGFIYAILAIFGFIYGSNPVFGFIGNNCPVTWLHTIAAVFALILGFATPNLAEKRGKRS